MPDKDFLLPTVAQDADMGEILTLAYSNRESLRRTLETGMAHYWSRSRNALWKKGETSGNTQKFVSASMDCDADALLFKVRPAGPACHTGARSCFFTSVEDVDSAIAVLSGSVGAGSGERGSGREGERGSGRAGERESGRAGERGSGDAGTRGRGDAATGAESHLEQIRENDTFTELFSLIESRKQNLPEESYTARLLRQGVDRIGKKIAEEAGEVIIAAKNQSREELLWESADLLYHLMVLLASQDVKWLELGAELEKRRKG